MANTQGTGKGISKAKARRQTRNKNYYAQRFFAVADHKKKRANRAANRKAYWIKRRVKKNGQPVRGISCEQTGQ